MTIAFACDHGGFNYKERVIEEIKSLGFEVLDFGCFGPQSVDYPDYAEKVAKSVIEGKAEKGILICGTGIGVSIAANKVKGIRCALVHDHLTSQLCRQHNDANLISFGARVIGIEVACECVRTFLSTDFIGGRHQRRLDKVAQIEGNF